MREVSLAVLDIAMNAVDAGAKHVEINVEFDANGLEFEVKDDGAGMDWATLVAAVQKGISFKGGAGLGLALLKEETESTGGKIEIDSRLQVGTSVKATYCGSPEQVVIGNLGETFTALADTDYDLSLRICAFGTRKLYDTSGLKSSSDTATTMPFGTLRSIREDINKFIRQNGGAML